MSIFGKSGKRIESGLYTSKVLRWEEGYRSNVARVRLDLILVRAGFVPAGQPEVVFEFPYTEHNDLKEFMRGCDREDAWTADGGLDTRLVVGRRPFLVLECTYASERVTRVELKETLRGRRM